jgi:uncharacterized iron-regulated membrane protein
MGFWEKWLRQPQSLWLRRATFQVHLWSGLALGVYVVVLSITGSILVYRNELNRWVQAPRPKYDATAKRLTREELKAAAERAYPGYTITRVGDRVTRRNPVVEIWIEGKDQKKERLFDPYTGRDLGDAVTSGELALIWVARLHDELLFDRAGRYWNGALSAAMTLLVLTGLVVWWPGIRRWRRSLVVKTSSGWKRFNWDLHSALGIWLFLFMLLWGVSGIYLGIPEPFSDLVDAISSPTVDGADRPGDIALLWLTRLHFGRWQSQPLKAAWAVAGLVPAIMFVTGLIMWWQRVVRPKRRRGARDARVDRSEGIEAG